MSKPDQPIDTDPRSSLLSHRNTSSDDHNGRIASAKNRIRQSGDLPGATVDQQLAMLDELASFELGRFLLEHHGLNAHWTHRLVTYRSGEVRFANQLEELIYEKLPSVLATRERFAIFQQQLQTLLRPGITMASVPCGFMGDLLLIDYTHHHDISLIGVDLDNQALAGARSLAEQQGLEKRLSLYCHDAWSLDLGPQVDVLTSNGLNIYEPNDDRVTALYRAFFDGLIPGGTLVTSFLTPPPALSADSPWREADPALLALQHLLFSRIFSAKWTSFRTHAQTQSQLETAGFSDIQFINDRMHMFPTVIARKPD
ncbi:MULTISPECIES: SAM-dependent methyltransferase [unclassified Brenneria]|uniref:SAM-dependent methyltransferase n=1 Tax=unclassified Brenneria TaxID=2634434 RepID=UPI001553C023|nr:class I SAM-dependent methyltransferase [Brenneria sp. hezel4-2-4]MEE3653037.1 class I SAM-dependent methyltransferase [Brenneria sp. HEZEL_4_2_4]NPD02990.1 class I SAM-dependent methyltransferase [Brenneria sp. hezel4-2-4]